MQIEYDYCLTVSDCRQYLAVMPFYYFYVFVFLFSVFDFGNTMSVVCIRVKVRSVVSLCLQYLFYVGLCV